jgi:SAM-dependent methyltransferase
MPPEEYWGADQWHWQWTPDYFSTEIGHAKRLLPFAPGMKALDIGVGLGKSMKSLEHAGFEAYGIEPSEPFYDKALSIMGLDQSRVTLAAVEEAEFPKDMFDFITFGAVLEHVYSPSLALSRAMSWLKPGGIIQAEVPSSHHLIPKFLNLFFRLRGTNYVTNISPMHSPFHLFEFSLRSFEKNGRRIGYEVAHHDFTVCAIYHLPKLVHPPLRWWMRRRNSGMQIAVYLRKPA